MCLIFSVFQISHLYIYKYKPIVDIQEICSLKKNIFNCQEITVQSTCINISVYRQNFKFPIFSFNIFINQFLLYFSSSHKICFCQIHYTSSYSITLSSPLNPFALSISNSLFSCLHSMQRLITDLLLLSFIYCLLSFSFFNNVSTLLSI